MNSVSVGSGSPRNRPSISQRLLAPSASAAAIWQYAYRSAMIRSVPSGAVPSEDIAIHFTAAVMILCVSGPSIANRSSYPCSTATSSSRADSPWRLGLGCTNTDRPRAS